MLRRYATALSLVAAATLLAACESSDSTTEMPTTQSASLGVLNDTCPVMGEPVSADAPTASYMGHSIGFCCGGCVGKWDEMSDADKEAFVAKYVK